MSVRHLVLLFAAVAVAVALGLVAGRWLMPDGPSDGSGVAAIGGPFTLVDHTGRTVTEADYAGRYLLVYFGYTYCPDVCPTELQTMTEALDLLGQDAAPVQPLFVTVDPERDTVKEMANYVSNFHDRLVGLTGNGEQVAAAAKVYRVYFAKGPVDDDGAYLMDHSSFIYLLAPDGRYLAHFGPRTPPQEMADSIRSFL